MTVTTEGTETTENLSARSAVLAQSPRMSHFFDPLGRLGVLGELGGDHSVVIVL
jgi:hypothetical protein